MLKLPPLGEFSQVWCRPDTPFSSHETRSACPPDEPMMIDALNATGPGNLELIHLDEPRGRAYWQIVNRVGPRAIDVRRHATRARHAQWQRRHINRRTRSQTMRGYRKGRPLVRADRLWFRPKFADAADKTAARPMR